MALRDCRRLRSFQNERFAIFGFTAGGMAMRSEFRGRQPLVAGAVEMRKTCATRGISKCLREIVSAVRFRTAGAI